MNTEELLVPRYKVIADYFYNPYKVGDIITVMYDDRSVHLTTTRYRDEFGEMVGQQNYMHPDELKKFPHLFKKLEWWEERKPEEMPTYVKWESGKVSKVITWKVGCDFCKVIDHTYFVSTAFFTPSTQAEQKQYINQKEVEGEG